MGHTFAEMDPAGHAKRQQRHSRIQELRKVLENVSLSKFTVGEFLLLQKLAGECDRNLNDEDILRLEEIAKNIAK